MLFRVNTTVISNDYNNEHCAFWAGLGYNWLKND